MNSKTPNSHGLPHRRNTPLTIPTRHPWMNNINIPTAEGTIPVCPEVWQPHPTQFGGCVAFPAQYRHTAGGELTALVESITTAKSSHAPAADSYWIPVFEKSDCGVDYSTGYNQIETGIYSPYSKLPA